MPWQMQWQDKSYCVQGSLNMSLQVVTAQALTPVGTDHITEQWEPSAPKREATHLPAWWVLPCTCPGVAFASKHPSMVWQPPHWGTCSYLKRPGISEWPFPKLTQKFRHPRMDMLTPGVPKHNQIALGCWPSHH